MKKFLIYGLLLVVFFVNMGAGCGSQTNDPQPDNFPGIVGKWKLTRTGYYLTKTDGTKVNDTFDTEPRGINIVYEFFSDGRLVVTDGQKNITTEIRWTLKVNKSDDNGILEGQLIQIGSEQKKLAESIGQSGDLTFQISTTSNFMALIVDVTKQSTYPEMILMQNFKKL